MVSESGISEEINGEELLQLFVVLELDDSLWLALVFGLEDAFYEWSAAELT